MTNPVQVIINDIKKLGVWGTIRMFGTHAATAAAASVLTWGVNSGWHF